MAERASSNTPAIEIKGLTKTYVNRKTKAEKQALKGIDLTVPRGAFYGLLGPNGAGKSTLINILAGLVNKTSGTASICGYDIHTHTRQAKQSIGVVPQELVLDPFFPVVEVLDIHAGYYGIPKSQRRTHEIIEAVGLKEQAHVSARKLSGGMRRRLLVAKALVHSPDVLILDEPTAGVDVELREQLWSYVAELNKAGTTILLTTHYLEEAEALCDRIAVINHGEVIVEESKDTLLKTLDYKHIKLTLDKTIDSIPASLQNYQCNLITSTELEITYHPSKIRFDTILQAITDANLSICDLSTEEADLEDIFRHLTKANEQ